MKKGAVPELNQKWWSKNKGVTVPKTGLGDVLKDYEIAKDRSSPDYEDMLKKLALVEKKVKVAIDKCNKTLHSETIDALKKYPGVIKAEETWIKKNYEAYKKRFEDEVSGKVPVQKVGGPVIVWKREIGKDVLKGVKAKNIDLRFKATMQLKLNDDILDTLEKAKDNVSAALMSESAEKLGKKLIAGIIDIVDKVDAAVGKAADDQAADKLCSKAETEIKSLLEAQEKEIKKIPAMVWAEFVKRNNQYKDYKIKAGTDLAIQTLTVVGGAVATGAAAAGTFGAGGAIGVVALVRDCANLAKQIYNLAIEAETVQKGLKGDIDTLTKAYRNKARLIGQEATGTVLKAALSTDAPFIATLPKCNSNLELFDNKVAGLEVNGRKYASSVTKTLLKIGQLENDLQKLTNKNARKAFDKLVETRKNLDKSLIESSKMMKRVRKTKPDIEGLKKALDALNDSNPKYMQIFDKVLPVVVNLALAGASAGVGFVDAKSALDTANTALGLSNAVLNEVKGGIEMI